MSHPSPLKAGIAVVCLVLSASTATGYGHFERPSSTGAPGHFGLNSRLVMNSTVYTESPNLRAAVPTSLWWAEEVAGGSQLGSYIDAVSCTSNRFCVALVGLNSATQFGYVTYNGYRWGSVKPAPGISGPLSCVARSFCVAARGEGFASYEGQGWDEMKMATPLGPGSMVTALSCTGKTFCMATSTDVGLDGNVLTYNGSIWSEATRLTREKPLNRLSCSSAEFCATIDYNGAVFTFQNGVWSAAAAADLGDPSSMDCVDRSFCVAISNNTETT